MEENVHDQIGEYVQRCEVVVRENDHAAATDLCREVSGILNDDISSDHCIKDIPRIASRLRTYGAMLEYDAVFTKCHQPKSNVLMPPDLSVDHVFQHGMRRLLEDNSIPYADLRDSFSKIADLKKIAECEEDISSKWKKAKPIMEYAISRGVPIGPTILQLAALALHNI